MNRLENEIVEYYLQVWPKKEEFFEPIEKKLTGQALAFFFKKITDTADREFREFETQDGDQKFQGIRIIGHSQEKNNLFHKSLVTLDFIPKTKDVALKFFCQPDAFKPDMIFYTDLNGTRKINCYLSEKIMDDHYIWYGTWLKVMKANFEEQILTWQKEGLEIKINSLTNF